MKAKAKKTRILTIIYLSLVLFIVTPIVCNAQDWSRKGKGEIFVFGQQMTGDTTTGLGIELEVDDTTVGGFGMGANLNDHLNLNLDIFFGSTDVTAKGLGSTFKMDIDLYGMDLNLDYNILKSRFTPMITGGIGYINFSGTVGGYEFDETDFSYNLGAGFRWDITDHFLIKGVYRVVWTELEDSDGSIMLDGIGLSIGYLF